MKISNNPILPITLMLTVIAVGSATLDFFVPPMGDDLMFWNTLGLDGYTHPDRNTVSFILGHYFGCNGRLFDFLGPIVINLLPRAVASAVMGCMAAIFFYCIARLSCIRFRHNVAFSAVIILTTMAAMPWWDAMFLRVCQFNYLWGSTFGLLFILSFFKDGNTVPAAFRLISLLLLGFCAGSAHEQTGIALCSSMFVWMLFHAGRNTLQARRKYLLAGLFAGTLFAIASPALWHRSGNAAPGEPIPSLLLSTYPVLLLLLCIIIIMAATSRGRACLAGLCRSDWLVIVISASVAAMIGTASGIPGRTGFYSEACAIIALARMIPLKGLRIMPRPLAATVYLTSLALITIHFTTSVRWQRLLYREFNDVRDAYIASPDGIVCYDITDRLDVPPLTLYRVKGVADADDTWNLHAIETAYGYPGKTPAVIPHDFNGLFGELSDSLSIGPVTLYTAPPACTVITLDDLWLQYYPGSSPRVITHTTMCDGREIWIATPRVRDPGDYSLPVKTKL